MRRIILVAFVLGLIGTALELVLLEHFEDWPQLIPIGLIAAALLILVWYAARRTAAPLRVLQALMPIFMFAGVIGLTLHYQGNAEFELEMYPDRSGMELFREALMGATPALAPGTMIQLGLIGLAYTWRHPSLVAQAFRPAGRRS